MSSEATFEEKYNSLKKHHDDLVAKLCRISTKLGTPEEFEKLRKLAQELAAKKNIGEIMTDVSQFRTYTRELLLNEVRAVALFNLKKELNKQ